MAKSAFERKFRQNQRRVNRRLREYIADPGNEKNIHDVRVSIRRLDATFSLLPKKARRRHRAGIEKYRAFLKASSKARDCDIIAGRLSALGDLDTGDLQRKKRAELAKATRLARLLKKLPAIKLGDAPDSKRVTKVVRRIAERICRTMPSVLSDSSKIEELHRLRKDFRKLRYVLEMVPAGERKGYLKKAIGREVGLKELQALLGLIHDSDITIEYLRGRGSMQLSSKETTSRMQLYKKFVRYME
ncbi:MAG TPA: CHAD domain-containing protein [Nitrososphaera sp.]|nr:CHAD domain-containing protein [Nitrososphaera sp.]